MNKLDEMISSFPEAAKEYIKGKKLDEVECVIADLPGIARGKAVPATKFSRQNSFHLPDSNFFKQLLVVGAKRPVKKVSLKEI